MVANWAAKMVVTKVGLLVLQSVDLMAARLVESLENQRAVRLVERKVGSMAKTKVAL